MSKINKPLGRPPLAANLSYARRIRLQHSGDPRLNGSAPIKINISFSDIKVALRLREVVPLARKSQDLSDFIQKVYQLCRGIALLRKPSLSDQSIDARGLRISSDIGEKIPIKAFFAKARLEKKEIDAVDRLAELLEGVRN
jgi:hypothetical protein